MYCHRAATRGLALVILEKTMEQDALEAPVIVEQVEEDKVEDGDAPDTINVPKSHDDITTDSKPLVSRQGEHESKNRNMNDVNVGRMNRFLQAKILKR
jgi:hypothetical protein